MTETTQMIYENRPSNEEIIRKFVDKCSNSQTTRDNAEGALKFFFENDVTRIHWNSHKAFGYSKHIFDIKWRDIEDYHQFLDRHQGIGLSTKKNRFFYLKKFVIHVLSRYEESFDKFDRFSLYMQIKEEKLNFSLHGHKKTKTNKNITLEVDEIEQFLQHLIMYNYKHYLLYKTIIDTGMRVESVGEINCSRIDDEGVIIPIEEDLQKRMLVTKGKKREEVYYITEKFSNMLLDYYLQVRKQLNVKSNMFFVTQKGNRYSRQSVYVILTTYRDQFDFLHNVSPHTFRRTINTLRKLMGCPLEDQKILLNHAVGDVTVASYTKLKYNQFIKLFDTWNPYKYLKV